MPKWGAPQAWDLVVFTTDYLDPAALGVFPAQEGLAAGAQASVRLSGSWAQGVFCSPEDGF